MEGVSLFHPTVVEDPYPYYATLRKHDSIHYSPELDAWLLSRYDHVSQTFRAHDVFSSAPRGGSPSGMRFLLNSDPPEHTAMRRIVNRFFSADATRRLESRVRELTHRLVDDLVEANRTGQADIMRHIANPLPVIVIAELLGAPPQRRDDFKRWSDATIGGLNMAPRELAVSSMEMNRYFGELIDSRTAVSGDDLVSRLVRAGDALTRQELAMFCSLLLIAGNETTTNLIGNLVLALLSHPDQLALLYDHPGLIPAAVEETVRYDAPVQAVWRLTAREAHVDGTTIPSGRRVLLLQGSANRDGDHYADADRFDIARNPRDHVGFGVGIHFCLGTHLARLEARIVTEVLLARTAGLERAGAGKRIVPPVQPRLAAEDRRRRPRVRRHPVVRGMRTLPVTFETRS
jgi:cytochrome P450